MTVTDGGAAGWSPAELRLLREEARAEARAEVKDVLRRRYAAELLQALDDGPGATAAARRDAPPVRARASEPAPEEGDPGTGPELLYVYGVVAGGAPLPGGASLPRPVEAVDAQGLRAVVSRVPAAEFSQEALQSNLEDLDWLSGAARTHEQVLQALLPGPLVPFRLGTVFSSEARVVQMLEDRRRALVSALEEVRGSVEIGVKVIADPEELSATLPAVGPTEVGAGTGSGVAYLQRRRQERRAVEEVRSVATHVADEVHAVVSELASGAVRGRPHDSALSGEDGWMLLNGAYLVPDDRVAEVVATTGRLADRYGDRGVRIEATGPWPPYNFVAQEAAQ